MRPIHVRDQRLRFYYESCPVRLNSNRSHSTAHRLTEKRNSSRLRPAFWHPRFTNEPTLAVDSEPDVLQPAIAAPGSKRNVQHRSNCGWPRNDAHELVGVFGLQSFNSLTPVRRYNDDGCVAVDRNPLRPSTECSPVRQGRLLRLSGQLRRAQGAGPTRVG